MRYKLANKKPITVIMHSIEDQELYNRSLGTVILDIMEKQLGTDGLAYVMEQLGNKLRTQKEKVQNGKA